MRDGIASVYGLTDAKFGEMVVFAKLEGSANDQKIISTNVRGAVLSLEQNITVVVLFDHQRLVSQGDIGMTTGTIMSVTVGPKIISRVVDGIGRPIDGNGIINETIQNKIDVKAPGIIFRESVNEPLYTGLKIIDSLFPIGRGQRELIIGDRQTGKTTIATDTIISQNNNLIKNRVFCIYVAIGQKRSSVVQLINLLFKTKSLSFTTVVCGTASDPAPLNFLAPFTGATIAEWFRDNGFHSLIIYDDLSKHAVGLSTNVIIVTPISIA